MALRAGGEAPQLPGLAEAVGGGKDVRVAGMSRRFSKDYERLPETGVAMIYGAMSRIMLRRLADAVL